MARAYRVYGYILSNEHRGVNIHLKFSGRVAIHPIDAAVLEVQRTVPLVPLATID